MLFTGDGSIGEAHDIWKKCNALLGNGVHFLQVQIIMQGVSLLNVGGKLTNSSCSMNLVEDKVIFWEVLRPFRRSIEILGVSIKFHELKRHLELNMESLQKRKLAYILHTFS